MPIIALGNIPISRVVKTYIIACGVIKTTLNNHPSHVGYDTSTQVPDTSPVDQENSHWINMAKKPGHYTYLLLLMSQKLYNLSFSDATPHRKSIDRGGGGWNHYIT